MSVPSTSAQMVSDADATVTPKRKITQVIVDPGMDGSFVVDIDKMKQSAVKVPPRLPRAMKYEASMQAAFGKKATSEAPATEGVLAALHRAVSPSTEDPPAKSIGRAIKTINESDHQHPESALPEKISAPPQTRVYFDVPGYASLTFRYHDVKRVEPGYLVFITDRRHGGGSDFYPYTSKMSGDSVAAKPMAVCVDGHENLYLLQPGSIVFRQEPFEFCLVPILEERVLPDELREELGFTTASDSSLQSAIEGYVNGKARSNSRGADSAGEVNLSPVPDDGVDLDISKLDFTVGGEGSVL